MGEAIGNGRGGDTRRRTLQALCDTFVPSLAPSPSAPGDAGFWERAASDLEVADEVVAHIERELRPADRDGLWQLVDLLGVLGFRHLPRTWRERLLHQLRRAHPDLARGLDALRALTMLLFYGLPVRDGGNPSWEVLGYPGPPQLPVAPDEPRIRPLRPRSDAGELVLDADVCVVGSGSGGGVVAGVLAEAGLHVVVVEAGGHHEDRDFTPYEVEALRRLYWRGGYTPTEDGNVTMVAGATLGGGSTVNWTNCVRPPERVRSEWAQQHGLKGLDGADFDEHLDAVLARLHATRECSDCNGPNSRLREAAEARGWSWALTLRNADAARYDPQHAGHMGFGDRTGSKLGTLKTYLQDAVDAGADIIADCHVERVLVQAGQAVGVQGTYRSPSGRPVPVTVRARQVVVAAGALETPALLLRSGIGGPAVGLNLRLHPVAALTGFYEEDQRAWWGPPQAVVVDEFADLADGFGFLLECPHFGVGVNAASVPWRSGRDHKEIMSRGRGIAAFIALLRERGAGRVTLDDAGEAVVTYPVADALDLHHLRVALSIMTQAHVTAGATRVLDLHPARALWRRTEDPNAFIQRVQRLPFGARGRPLFSAHQMGTARMGGDPGTSAADPEGQLHDTAGVWIGDTSVFPTAVGSNPMLTCMALARRTAHALLANR